LFSKQQQKHHCTNSTFPNLSKRGRKRHELELASSYHVQQLENFIYCHLNEVLPSFIIFLLIFKFWRKYMWRRWLFQSSFNPFLFFAKCDVLSLVQVAKCFFSITQKGRKKIAFRVWKITCLVKEEVPSFATTIIALNNS
jgi:hypothetical protein